MVMLRDWDEKAVALRLADRQGGETALYIAEKLIRKWAESDAPSAAGAAVRWVRIKAILLSLTVEPSGVH